MSLEAALGYSKEHIERTRQRILDHAGELFRRFGYRGVGIDKIMNAADLTRGGFYAHFKSKSELFQKVVAEKFDYTNQITRLKSAEPTDQGGRALFAIRHYLGAHTRDHIGLACTMAASAVDVANSDEKTKAAFEARMIELLSEMKALFAEDGVVLGDEQVQSILALSVGGLVLARACTEGTATDMLDACYNAIEDGVRSRT